MHPFKTQNVTAYSAALQTIKTKFYAMKKLNLLLGFLIGITISSCSSDDNTPHSNDTELSISKWIRKNYTFYDNTLNIYTENPILQDSIEYIIANDKLINSSGIIYDNNDELIFNSTITYSGNKIIQTKFFINDILSSEENYSYNSLNDLIEYKIKEGNEYLKSEFTYVNDTIYKSKYSSIDDISYTLSSSGKVVLDINNNCTYFEDTTLGFTNKVLILYDANNNVISVTPDGRTGYNYTYSLDINTEQLIINNTLTRKVNMLINAPFWAPVNAKSVSPNMILNINPQDNLFGFSYYNVSNETNEDGYSIISNYREFNTDDSANSLEYSEFIFE